MEINHRSLRTAKARLYFRLKGLMLLLLWLLALALLAAGIGLLVIGVSFGWFVVTLFAPPLMVIFWYDGELKNLKPDTHSETIDGVLGQDILAQLKQTNSPHDVATILGKIPDGLFFGARFGLTAGLLQHIASEKPEDMQAVWQEALGVKDELGLSELGAGCLIIGLLEQLQDYNSLLAQLHIELEDVKKGILWQKHLRELIHDHQKPRRTGGIARDWSFGYIPLLSRFGQNISEQIARGGLLTVDLEAHRKALDQLLETFGTGGRQNAVLVGPTGVGKTTVVHAFAERLLDAAASVPSSLRFRQVIILDAASLIAAAPGRGQLEDLIMRVLGEAFAAKNIIICLDNAQMFFEEGIGSVDLTNVLLPILEAGRLRVILAMDEQRFLQIGQRNSSLTNALNRISIAPPSQNETMQVMQDQLIMIEFQRHVTYTYQSLQEAYRLSERYVHDVAMPGRALKLLESAANYSENGLVTINSVQQAIEQTTGVKVSVASEIEDREKLLHLEDLIHKRMVNQSRAVAVVSDALRRARTGVRNQNRPIGTFLFLGPTGVGKTELAKALADVYFGGEERLIRIDLNEFVQSSDVNRLIADGADDPTSLTAQVMKQPFSMVLLDEIEKAAPEVLTTLLQLLDEGILRDIKNREVSFRDAIVIATSNAGANRIREYISRGYKMEQFEQQFTDELISSGQFKPEFLNRFDEIAVFRPFTKDELLQVCDLIIAGVNKTLEAQKVQVIVETEAKLVLVEKGYDPRLGARPMRRVVQRAVENTVAKLMLGGQVAAGSSVRITKEQVEQILGSVQAANDIIDGTGQIQGGQDANQG